MSEGRAAVERVRLDAGSVIADIGEWELPVARWSDVEGLLAALSLALDAGDLAAAADVISRLELSGPVRSRTRIGQAPAGPPPPPVRERLNQLVHQLTVPAAIPGDEDETDESQQQVGP
ncbi:MAG TPA: CATRA system-associated protein [Trebonia sp.]|jgi:hypothetical protein|nr:CATRA system-associated protein [Trebonia sp.]